MRRPRHKLAVLVPHPDPALGAALFTDDDLLTNLRNARTIVRRLDRDRRGNTRPRETAAVRVWLENYVALVSYGWVMQVEAIDTRGIDPKRVAGYPWHPGPWEMPEWAADSRVHEAHRALLLRRNPAKYSGCFPNTDPTTPMWWPLADVDLMYDDTVKGRCLACGDSPKGCEYCAKYLCPGCNEWRHWANGGTDSEVCDACWCEGRR